MHRATTPSPALSPIVFSMKMPTTKISKFLNQLIRPLFDYHVHAIIVIDGADLIRRLETYAANGHLKSATFFCTFGITDLYTMLLQEESLNILTEFLNYHGYHKVKDIPLDAIRKLACIVLKENYLCMATSSTNKLLVVPWNQYLR
jgi:hypothetical protein